MLRQVRIKNGIVRGIEAADPRVTAFRGIPFAAPAVGINRWRAPQPCENWEGVLDCARFRAISMQPTPGEGDNIYCREWHVDPDQPMDEDCLFLNVWTPANREDEKLPVLVWFFGGGLQCGYPSEMEFDGERLARNGIIVVSVNYRVGVFGFLAHPEITAEAPDAPANFGHLDQRAGLLWVKENIAAFGGDPEHVTIAGQSAGGGSVMAQLACPENKGLIHGAVVMSGMIRTPYKAHGDNTPSPVAPGKLEAAQKLGEEFFEFIGAADLTEARKIPGRTILEKYFEFTKTHPIMLSCIDGKFTPDDPQRLFALGRNLQVPVIAGNTEDEFMSLIAANTEEELKTEADKIFGETAEKFLSFKQTHDHYYHRDEFGSALGMAPVSGIETTVKATYLSADKNGSTAPHYYYCFKPDIPGDDHPGTFHSCDLWFWFETLAKCTRPYIGRHYDLARQMSSYLVNFVKTGDPNGKDRFGEKLPEWKRYTNVKRRDMLFTGDGAVPVSGKESGFVGFLIDHEMRGF